MKIEILITFVVALLPLAAVTAQNVTVPDDTAQTDTVPVNTVTADDIADLNGCSYHQYYSCHDEALCIDTADEPGRWKCVCQGDLEGDGLKEGTGCGPRSCRFASECHKLANCTEMAGCECLSGYEGDGWDECRDEDECVDLPCSQYALCENTDGGFRCTCKMQLGYVGDGFTCHHQCSVDYDCGANEKCRAEVCVCAPGYEAGDTGCVDENECEANPCDGNATCVNTIGSFVCTCKNGFAGNGEECKALPRNCHEVKIALPGSRSGKYTIDPDGTGDMDAIEVECEMRPAFGITIVKPIETKHVRYTRRDPNTTYEYTHPVEDIKAIIATSGFCYQEMTYECYQGAQLMDGDDFWVNGNGEKEVNWGGASISGMCACGQLGYCEDRSQACNCDGFPIKRIDAGKVVDKARLPILAVNIHPGDKGYGFVLIGSVMCAPTPFDIPINCHDAKFNPLYNKRKNGPQVLDFDGPDGALDPVLAHCDMETWRHVGVTVIPHSRSQPTTPNSTDPIPLEYVIGTLELNALIDVSTNCMQEAEYECTNSRLMNNGDRRGWWTDINGRNRDSWPGGLGESNKCACAITKTCASDSYGCNCDVMDGNTRKDFGRVYEKTAIGAVTFLDVGGDSRGAFSVGPLMCADREFGIPATCQDYVATGYTDSHTYIVDPDGPAPKAGGESLVSWESGDGRTMSYFAGDGTSGSVCACGMTEPSSCTGRGDCECDMADAVTRVDEGLLINKKDLPVASLNVTGVGGISGQAGVLVGPLMCKDLFPNCAEMFIFKKNKRLESENSMENGAYPVDPDGEGGVEPFLVRCTSTETTVPVVVGWSGSRGEEQCACGVTGACAGGPESLCNCDLEDGVQRKDGGWVVNKDRLAVCEVRRGKTCQQWRDEGKTESEALMIDPDGSGPLEPVPVHCVLQTYPPAGWTEIIPKTPEIEVPEEGTNVTVEYYVYEMKVIYELIARSRYCTQELVLHCVDSGLELGGVYGWYSQDGVVQESWAGNNEDVYRDCEDIRANNARTNPLRNNVYAIDPDMSGEVEMFAATCDFITDKDIGITVGIQYVCYKSPLINGNSPAQSYYTTYGGASSPSWGVAGHPDVSGCACMATGTCPPGHSCHCDSMGSMTVDYGHETDRQVMPIEQLNFGDLPEDCQDAYERGSRTGEHLIWPSTEVEPFLVYCDMDILPDGGVTIIGHDRESGSPVTFNVTEKVTYKDADDEQLLSRDGYFTWIGGLDNAPQSYVGSGRPFAHECNCGLEGLCGGSEDKETLKATGRACNCDAADDVLRADAGVFNSSVRLPVRELTFTDPELAGAYGYLVLGRLYCSKQDFDINECRSEFHDCHDHASCINTHGAYDCYCKPGWRGLGRPDVWANGRNCYDDDECAMNQCPWSADCENLPGTFECTCKPGFRQLGPRKCEDIDECAEGTHECHANARCFNLAGTLALCTCFGDPHCITYDTRLITYQGTCQYVMARDTCDDYDTTPSFEVLVTFETRGKVKGPASWVVYTDIGVEVSWNGQAAVEVHTPGTFANTTCGLCGNYNGDPADDLTVGPQCPDDEGKQAENVNRFGNSWVVPAWVAENPECASDCSAPPDPGLCNGTNLEQAKFTCDKIWDTNGPFQECISGMDETAIEMYYTSCLYDMCQVDGDIEGEHTCGENMEYKICGPLGEPTCADFRSGTTPGENGTLSGGDTDGCHEGCFCKEGYMLDGEDCVPEEECGCVFNDQYYSVGDEFVVDGCGSRSVCQPGGNMPEEGVTCHENATCDLQDGRYGCHCRDGFYGDGVHVCVEKACELDSCEDPCDPDPCGENEVCIRTPETDKLYIDECLTATDTCPQNARCINTEGSFECECFDGFIMSAGQCDDVDECKLASKNTCGNNSKCSNKPGGFECPCCAGFEKDDNGECVATEGPGAANSPVCCVCDAAICDEPGKVNSCSNVDCPLYQNCVKSEETGKPTCVCDPCTATEVESEEKVCSSSLVIYPNMCVFKQIQCMMDWESVPESDLTPCEEAQGESPVGPWSDWGPCSVTCGKGESSRTRPEYRPGQPYDTVQTEDCYEDPCPDGPCFNFDCNNVAAECVVNDEGDPECECPKCTDIGVDEVCGYVSGVRGVKPLNCTRVPHMEVVHSANDTEYRSLKSVQTFACEGGCGHNKDQCCQASKTEGVTVIMKNLVSDLKEEEIQKVLKK
ncbi:FCGBP-like protein [Mya arenaria]|uniref:FCGBP-like protein n=1 Tax=Mya arenaria TaxID=6604 RepID=A0ABY7EBC8_MYAAR|nr:FCGBP-like protein [Mya arenaria]